MSESVFVKLLEKKFISEGYLTKREVGVGYGVADLVLYRLDPKKCAVRRKNGQYKKLQSEDFFKIFDYLPENGSQKQVDVNYLANNLNISEKNLKYNYLKKLENDGFVRKINNKFYYKVNGWMPIAKEVIAIEAKINDWRKGAIQANRYKTFAHKTYLALPFEKGHLVDKKFLKEHNIGLILFDTKSRVKKTTRIKSEAPLNKYKFNFAAEFALGRRNLKECFS